MEGSPYKHNKPTAPPPPGSSVQAKAPYPVTENPPDYAAATTSQIVQRTLVSGVMGIASADTVITKSVVDKKADTTGKRGSKDDGWTRVTDHSHANDDSDDEDAPTASDKPKFKKPNTIVNQESDDKYVKITMKIPGLKVKFLTHNPKNGRLLKHEYNRNKVSVTFVVNEDREDRKQTYMYESREPLKMSIQEEGSYFRYAEDIVKWRIRKAK